MSENHCIDCCCAQSWKALGITEYTEKSIPEHIELLQQQIENLEHDLESWKKRTDEADKQIEDLKCCGNCIFFLRFECPIRKDKAHDICPKWQSDGLTAKEREI